MQKIAVGVSGGIDSAATVMFLKERGYSVHGVRFSVMGSELDFDNSQLSERLGIEIETVDISQSFNQTIISNFIESYMSGATPSPCVECNCSVKWSVIKQYAKKIGADNWATGHYAQNVEHNGLFYIAKGADRVKDQSYYLWKLSQSTLKGAIMPLGSSLKSEVREFMISKGFKKLAEKSESMGICFLGKGGYKELLKEKIADINNLKGGQIVDREGRVVGQHDGYPFYTLAQRKGLALSRPNCVVAIDVKENKLIVGDENELFCDTIKVTNYQFTSLSEILETKELEVKVRGVGRNPEGYCRVEIIDEKTLVIKLLSDKAWAVTTGQPVVFYIRDRVVGGGYAQ